MKYVQMGGRWLLAAGMLYAGTRHFVNPAPFIEIVPDGLPAPRALVFISGFFEILGGLGLLVPPTRRVAAWGLIALFIAVFPANVHMATHRITFGMPLKPWMLWARLPLQLVLIAWAWLYTRRETS